MTTHILAVSSYLTSPIEVVLSFIGSFFVGTFNLVKGLGASYIRARNIRRTVIELNKLKDHELRDIGIGRGDIYAVASGQSDHRRYDKTIKAETNPNLEGSV